MFPLLRGISYVMRLVFTKDVQKYLDSKQVKMGSLLGAPSMHLKKFASPPMKVTTINVGQEISATFKSPREYLEKFVLCLAPFAPHLGEELWSFLGHGESLAYEPWPVFDPAALVENEVEIPVQVMGKLRGRIRVPLAATPAEMEAIARANPDVAKHLEGKTIVKVVAVPKRMVNFVIR